MNLDPILSQSHLITENDSWLPSASYQALVRAREPGTLQELRAPVNSEHTDVAEILHTTFRKHIAPRTPSPPSLPHEHDTCDAIGAIGACEAAGHNEEDMPTAAEAPQTGSIDGGGGFGEGCAPHLPHME
jgi:hypothetical protein